MTPFEIAQEQGNYINYLVYELAINKFHFNLMAQGMKTRNVTYKVFKTYYGLKSRNVKDGFAEFMIIFDKYMSDNFVK